MALIRCLCERCVRGATRYFNHLAKNALACWMGLDCADHCGNARKCSQVAAPRAIPGCFRGRTIDQIGRSSIAVGTYLVVNQKAIDRRADIELV